MIATAQRESGNNGYNKNVSAHSTKNEQILRKVILEGTHRVAIKEYRAEDMRQAWMSLFACNSSKRLCVLIGGRQNHGVHRAIFPIL